MTEIITNPVPDGGTPPIAGATEFSLSKFVNETGDFQAGWKENLLPEDMRHRPVYDSFGNVKDALKHIGHLESVVGKKGVIVPTDKSTPSEIEAFRNAIGVPKAATDYKVEIPEELKEFYSPDLINNALSALHQAGATQKVVDAVMALDRARTEQSLQAYEEQKKREFDAAAAALDKKWGAAKEQNLHLANRVIHETVQGDEEKQQVLELIGNNPLIADIFARIGSKLVESKAIDTPVNSAILPPAEAEMRMKELMATAGYLDGSMKNSNPGAYTRINREIAELARMAVPQKK